MREEEREREREREMEKDRATVRGLGEAGIGRQAQERRTAEDSLPNLSCRQPCRPTAHSGGAFH